MSPGFGSKAKEQEKYKRADNDHPSAKFKRDNSLMIQSPYGSWELLNMRIVEMSIAPRDVWLYWLRSSVEINRIRGKGSCTNQLDCSQCHESEVSIPRQARIG